MTRVRERTILANFRTRTPAQEVARRIREEGLGDVQVSLLTDRAGAASDVFLASPDLDEITDALDHPGALLGRRPRLGNVLLAVVTEEDKVAAVVALVKEKGGSV